MSWLTQQMDIETTGGGVAWWAHIGGFAFGLLAGFVFRTKGRLSGIELEKDY